MATVNDVYDKIPYGLDQECNNTDVSEHKDCFDGNRVQHCNAETEDTHAVKEVSHKNN